MTTGGPGARLTILFENRERPLRAVNSRKKKKRYNGKDIFGFGRRWQNGGGPVVGYSETFKGIFRSSDKLRTSRYNKSNEYHLEYE